MATSDTGDPFAAFGSDRTVIKPTAGRGAASAPATPAAAPAKEVPLSLDTMMSGSLNPLVNAALPLLATAPRLRQMARHPNPTALRDALADGVRKFEAQARTQGLPNEQVIAGRYILCTLLDEAASCTPWGGSGAWAANSLLVQFHNESWGGEKVFQLMSKLAQNVDANRQLLELLYVVLGLGFQGRYRALDNGEAQVDSVRQRLAQMLGQGRSVEPSLSPRWQGVAAPRQRLVDGLPLWLVGSILLFLLALVYAGLRWSLAHSAGGVFETLAALDAKKPQLAAVAPPPPPPASAPRLAALLAPEVHAGQLEVQGLADRSIVLLRGEGLFEPGSAVLSSEKRPVVVHVGEVLSKLPGKVLISGHTDNQPIRTVRFPSNWHLSQERADAVKAELARQVEPARLRAEGRADSQPIADNASAPGRARNRRVEVTLFPEAAP